MRRMNDALAKKIEIVATSNCFEAFIQSFCDAYGISKTTLAKSGFSPGHLQEDYLLGKKDHSILFKKANEIQLSSEIEKESRLFRYLVIYSDIEIAAYDSKNNTTFRCFHQDFIKHYDFFDSFLEHFIPKDDQDSIPDFINDSINLFGELTKINAGGCQKYPDYVELLMRLYIVAYKDSKDKLDLAQVLLDSHTSDDDFGSIIQQI